MTNPCDTTGSETLSEEVALYESKRSEFLLDYEGKFVLIKGSEVAGFFDDESEAYKVGLERFGNTPFLIRQVARQDAVQNTPALHFGLIRAHT